MLKYDQCKCFNFNLKLKRNMNEWYFSPQDIHHLYVLSRSTVFTYILQNWISNLKRPENRHSLEDFPELLQILHCNLLYKGSRGCRNHFTCTKLQILDLLWFKSIATHKILLLIAKLVPRFLSIIVHQNKCKTTNAMLCYNICTTSNITIFFK